MVDVLKDILAPLDTMAGMLRRLVTRLGTYNTSIKVKILPWVLTLSFPKQGVTSCVLSPMVMYLVDSGVGWTSYK